MYLWALKSLVSTQLKIFPQFSLILCIEAYARLYPWVTYKTQALWISIETVRINEGASDFTLVPRLLLIFLTMTLAKAPLISMTRGKYAMASCEKEIENRNN